jgi:hypothetical protein
MGSSGCNDLDLYPRFARFESLPGHQLILIEAFRSFPQFFQEMPQIGHNLLFPNHFKFIHKKQINSVVLVRKQTIPTE